MNIVADQVLGSVILINTSYFISWSHDLYLKSLLFLKIHSPVYVRRVKSTTFLRSINIKYKLKFENAKKVNALSTTGYLLLHQSTNRFLKWGKKHVVFQILQHGKIHPIAHESFFWYFVNLKAVHSFKSAGYQGFSWTQNQHGGCNSSCKILFLFTQFEDP